MPRPSRITYLSLREVHRVTGISLPTLRKYKAQETGPGGALEKFTLGEGRFMMFRQDSCAVFRRLAQK